MSNKTRSIIGSILLLLLLVVICILFTIGMNNMIINNKNRKVELKQLVIAKLYSYQETHNVIEEFSINGVVDIRVTELEYFYENGELYANHGKYAHEDGTKLTLRLFNVEIFTYNDILIYKTQAFVVIDGHFKNSDRVHEDVVLEIDYELIYMKERQEIETYDLVIVDRKNKEYEYLGVVTHQFNQNGFLSIEFENGDILHIRIYLGDIQQIIIDR